MISRRHFLLFTALAACGGATASASDDAAMLAPVCTPTTTASFPATYPGGGAFVVRRLRYGEIDEQGAPSRDGWRKIGENIDGISSTRSDDKGECRLRGLASPANRDDGDDGIDNAWGHVLVPFIGPFIGQPTNVVSAAIERSARTPMFLVGAWPHGSDAKSIEMGFVFAEPTSTPPRWDGTDVRAIAAAWTDGSRSSVSFPNARACAHEVASGEATAPVRLELAVALTLHQELQTLRVPLRRAHVRMRISPDGSTASGTISGVIATDDAIRAFDDLFEAADPTLCQSSTKASIEETIRQASDILVDGSQNPNVDCNAISFAIGFEAVSATAGDIAQPEKPAAPSPCPP